MTEVSPDTPGRGSHNLFAFGATALLNDTASEMAYWILPAFLASIGAGPAQLGIIEGIAESVASFAKLLSGYLADNIQHRKPVVVWGYFVANAVKPLLALATSWWHVLGIRFADRLSKGIRGTPRDVMLADSVPKSRLGSAFGLLQAMDSAGAIAGPLLALLLLPHYGLRGTFWFAGIPGALCVAAALFGIREVKRRRLEEPDHPQAAPRLPTHFPGKFYVVLLAVSLFSLGNSSDMFLVLRAQNLGIPAAHAPLLGLVFNITYTLFSWPAGGLSDRVSRRVLAAAGYLVFAVVYFTFAIAPSILAIWLAMAFYGLFYALTEPVLKALVVGVVAPESRGRALGIYSFITSIAILLASLLTGGLWKFYGPRIPFYVSAGIAIAAAALLLISRATRSIRAPAK
ncbi:MAG: MFS transporter [Terriglobales bacterium]